MVPPIQVMKVLISPL